MVEQGARRIVLLGRSGLPPRTDWSAVDPASRAGRRIAAVRDLEALGASVHLGAVDVADEPALREFLETFRREGWPSIRGVVHAAGTVHYGPLVQTTPAQLDDVLRSKVAGAWLLHRLLAGEALDFFVLFSSASGRAELAPRRRLCGRQRFPRRARPPASERGPPALSIDWGLWAGAGMAEQVDAEGLAALTARGMGSLSPEQALEALGAFLGSSTVQVGVIPVNWPVWRERYPMFTAAPFLAEMLAAETAPPGRRRGAAPARICSALEPVARAEALLTRLRGTRRRGPAPGSLDDRRRRVADLVRHRFAHGGGAQEPRGPRSGPVGAARALSRRLRPRPPRRGAARERRRGAPGPAGRPTRWTPRPRRSC